MALLEVARIARAHGLRGEVVVDLLTNRTERLEPGSVLTVQSTRASDDPASEPRTLVVSTSRPFQHRWLVSFDGVTRREEAEALHQVTLLAEPIEDPNELFVHELIGCELVDQRGDALGTVTAVEANPASDLLVIDDRFYVPARFILRRDTTHVYVDIPEGLFDQ